MACCFGSQPSEVSQRIDNEIKAERMIVPTPKFLLLGPGNAGKSTFAKQLIFSHKPHEVPPETFDVRDNINFNLLQTSKAIINDLQARNKPIMMQPAKISLLCNWQIVEVGLRLPENIADAISEFYREPAVKKFIERRGESLINGQDGTHYLFSNVKRFARTDFVPTKEDILRVRKKTTGVHEYHIETALDNKTFRGTVVDVGGQQSERKKWLSLFQEARLIIFLVAANEYDLYLEENISQNRLVDALSLFSTLTAHHDLREIPWILFLNKIDLFEQKIAKVPLSVVFSGWDSFIVREKYEKLPHLEQSVNFLKKQFQYKYRGASPLTIFTTSMFDSENVRHLWNQLILMQRKERLELAGLSSKKYSSSSASPKKGSNGGSGLL